MSMQAKTIEVDYEEWMRIHHMLDELIKMLVRYEITECCDEISATVDNKGTCWCEKNCIFKSSPTKECWMQYLKERVGNEN